MRGELRISTIFAQASPSRLSESCRVLFWVLGSRFSPRRLVLGLSDQYSRLGERGSPKRGENGSPKRGRDETLVLIVLNPRPGDEFCVLSEHNFAQASRARLSKMLWSSHWFILAQAR
ncbi:hypothetical protein DEO72_LG8g1685 [Vigna unguiculata]|uniref:Uncharacterized protein n=1 Tax=Vigna unguiculata TaxID=3917 RepID=A0A4D6MQ31_VIGUN|nr:hypothetical protein DEO72_LG8g1685 [Vigna unguiculata]